MSMSRPGPVEVSTQGRVRPGQRGSIQNPDEINGKNEEMSEQENECLG